MAEQQQISSSSSKIGKKRLPPYRTDRSVNPRLMDLQSGFQWSIGVLAGHLYLLAYSEEDSKICVYQYDTMAQTWGDCIPVDDSTVDIDNYSKRFGHTSLINGRGEMQYEYLKSG
jgi:hypothetical protein